MTTAQAHPARGLVQRGLLALEWGLTLTAAAVWAASRTYTGRSMDLALGVWLAAWAARWARLGRPTRATAADAPLLVFLASALVGLWAAPDFAEGLARLYLYLGAIGLFYLIVNSPAGVLAQVGTGLALAGAGFAVYFVTQHDWVNAPVKIAALSALGRALNALTPNLGLYQPHPNVAATGLMCVLPLAVGQAATALQDWRTTRRWVTLALVTVCLLVIGFGLVMTASRAAVLALAGAGAAVLWGWISRWLGRRLGVSGLRLFGIGLSLAVITAVTGVLLLPGPAGALLGSLPGPNSTVSRLEVFGQVWRLAQATPFTGGGLAAFPGLYSTWVLDIPVLFLTHAHNAYLNVLVEQGWPGLLSFAAVLGLGGWAGLRALGQTPPTLRLLRVAGLAGLAAIIIQGLADGTLVASRAVLSAWLPLGFALWVGDTRPALPSPRRRWVWAAVGTGAALLALTALLTGRTVWASWQANLGAVASNRILLADWPRDSWSTGVEAPALRAAEPYFDTALRLDPENRTAHYYLGQAALLRRDFETARTHLEIAWAADPGQRGVTKMLGYTQVWLGDDAAAEPLLAQVPEARSELDVYTWWWTTQSRPDLAAQAAQMLAQWPSETP